MKKKKAPAKVKPARVHEELKGFEISVNQFGEIKSSFDIEKINEFLDRNVKDKKLKNPTKATRKGGKKKS